MWFPVVAFAACHPAVRTPHTRVVSIASTAPAPAAPAAEVSAPPAPGAVACSRLEVRGGECAVGWTSDATFALLDHDQSAWRYSTVSLGALDRRIASAHLERGIVTPVREPLVVLASTPTNYNEGLVGNGRGFIAVDTETGRFSTSSADGSSSKNPVVTWSTPRPARSRACPQCSSVQRA
jgi:hypothetical protein